MIQSILDQWIVIKLILEVWHDLRLEIVDYNAIQKKGKVA